MRFLSLFSGIGGMDLGLERAGMTCVGQVENEPYAIRVLQKHWPHVWRHGDINTLTGRLVSTHCGRIDLIAGGDPCQENANCRQGNDAICPSLGDQFIRVIDEVCPFSVLRENPSRVRRDAPWPWRRFRAELERRNYAVVPFRLRACCCGADHQRERLFLYAEIQDSHKARLEGDERQIVAGTHHRGQDTDAARSIGGSTASRVCGKPHGIPNRMERLSGLGNAVVPQVAEWIGRRIMEARRKDERTW